MRQSESARAFRLRVLLADRSGQRLKSLTPDGHIAIFRERATRIELGYQQLLSPGKVLEGAGAVCTEAGITINGGHSIADEEPKFGLFVTGTAHPDKIVSNAGLKPGDKLVLTKNIGTGILTTAVKRGKLPASALQVAIASMTTLNRAAAEAMQATSVSGATDVTGFGLLGHLGNMLRASDPD